MSENGIGRRLWGVVAAPRATFAEIAAHARAWPVAVFAASVSLLAAFSTLPKLKAFALWQLEHGPRALPPEQLAAVRGFATTAAIVELIVTALIVPFVIWLAGAGLLKILSRRGNEPVPFNRLLAVTVYAYVPRLIADLVRAALIAAAPFQRFGSINTSLGALLPSGGTGLTGMILSYIDPFTLWALGLFSLGGAAALRVRTENVAFLVFFLWVVYVILGVFLGLRSPSA